MLADEILATRVLAFLEGLPKLRYIIFDFKIWLINDKCTFINKIFFFFCQ